MSKVTQKHLALQILKERKGQLIPVWWFIGERESQELGYIFFTHRAPARLTELYQEGLVSREMTHGKSGARYYSYRYD